jgi:chloramphenicol-sensitive protein RarD
VLVATYADRVPESRRGLLYGIAAYTMWGAFPLYWPLLEPAGATEILAHRVLWSAVVMGVLVLAATRRSQLRAILADSRARGLLIGAAALISVNWLTYIWAVNNNHVVESSLGYFINPLVSVLMGIVVLGETLRRGQQVALALAVVAVAVLAIDYGRPPWIALVLASSFGTYGLAKKLADAGAVESLAFETLLIAPFALAYVGWLATQQTSNFGSHGWGHALLLASTGVVTAVPLICFGAAAIRVPMVTLGLLQYLAPVLQFALGVFVLGEPMPLGRWIGFVLVWAALALFTTEALRFRRHQLRLAAEASAL